MGFLIVVVLAVVAMVVSSRRGGDRRPSWRRRAAGVVLVAVAGLAAVLAVGSFAGAATGNTEDMDPPQVVLLGCVYLAGALAVGFGALRLLRS